MAKTAEEITAEETAAAEAKAAEEKAAEEEKNKPTSWTLKIDGEEKEFTLDELKDAASKSAGADVKFQNAAQMKKDAEKGIEIGKAFEKINSGDFNATDVRTLAELTGQDPDEAVAAYTAEQKKAGGGGDDNKDKDKDKGKQTSTKVSFQDLPDDIQALLTEAKEVLPAAKERQIEQAREEVEKIVKEEVAKDELLGKIVIEAPEKLQAGIKEVIGSQVHADVQRKILASQWTKEKFGTEMIRNSIQKIRAEIKKLGIPSKSSQQADRVSLLAALGPTGIGLPAEVYSDEKVERVPSNDPTYEDNAVLRYAQKARQDLMKSQKSQKS